MNIKDQEQELFKKYKKGDQQARMTLLDSLTPVIKTQVDKFNGSGLPPISIFIEGKKLASDAIDSYNPKKSQLNTHVTNYLKKLSRFVTNYQNVGYIPEPRALMIGKYKTLYDNLEADKGRPPTAAELADALHVSIMEIERLQTELRNDLSANMDAPDEGESGFYEYLSPLEEDPKLKEAIEFVYFDTDPINKKILEMTFGLYGNFKSDFPAIQNTLQLNPAEFKKRKDELALKIKELL